MEIPFVHLRRPGRVTVTCATTTDPALLGAFPAAVGLPHLTARVEYQEHGYRALFGWVQLVRSTDNLSCGDGFELDPFALFADAPSPYCFFGFEPTLFEAPARDVRARMEWVAHAFLAYSPLDSDDREVVPIVGFSWGFDGDDRERVTPRELRRLADDDWAHHVPLLRSTFPAWTIADAGVQS